MIYKQKYSTDFDLLKRDFTKICQNAELNFGVLKEIDRVQKEKGEILYRYFRTPVADGYSVYQIVKLTKSMALVKYCTGICLDEYRNDILGDGCQIPIDVAKEKIRNRDYMEKVFGTY